MPEGDKISAAEFLRGKTNVKTIDKNVLPSSVVPAKEQTTTGGDVVDFLKKKVQIQPQESIPSASTSQLVGSTSELAGSTSGISGDDQIEPTVSFAPGQLPIGEELKKRQKFDIQESLKSVDFSKFKTEDRPPAPELPKVVISQEFLNKRRELERDLSQRVDLDPNILKALDSDESIKAFEQKILDQTKDEDLASSAEFILRRVKGKKDLLDSEIAENLDIVLGSEFQEVTKSIQQANFNLKKDELIRLGFDEKKAEKLARLFNPEEDIISKEEGDLIGVNLSKVREDYLRFLEKQNPDKAEDIQRQIFAGTFKGKENELKFLQEALQHQSDIVGIKMDRIISKGAENATEEEIALVENFEEQQDRLNNRFKTLLTDFPEIRERLRKEQSAQQRVDDSYKLAKAKALLPDFDGAKAKAEVLYQQVVAPIGGAAVNLVNNILQFGLTQVKDLVPGEYIPGMAEIVSDWSNSYLDTEKSGSIFKTPSAFKGALVIDGEIQTEKLVPKVAETLFQMLALIEGGGFVGGGLRALGAGVNLSGKVGLVASSFVQTHNDYFEEAKNLGLSDDEANNFAASSALMTSVLELINPQQHLLGKVAKRGFTSKVVKEIKDGIDLKTAIKNNSKFVAKEIFGENLQEISQEIGDISVKYLFNKRNEDHPFDVNVTQDDIKELLLLTTIVSGMASAPGIKSKSSLEKSALYNASRDLEKFNEFLNRDELKADFTEQELQEVSEKVTEYKKVVDGLPKNLDEDSKIKLANLVFNKKKLNEKKSEVHVDEAVQAVAGDDIQTEVDEIDGQISLVFEEQEISAVEKPVSSLDFNIEEGGKTVLKIDDKHVIRNEELIQRLNDEGFVQKVKDGEINLEIKNPPEDIANALEASELLTKDQLETIKPKEDGEKTKETEEAVLAEEPVKAEPIKGSVVETPEAEVSIKEKELGDQISFEKRRDDLHNKIFKETIDENLGVKENLENLNKSLESEFDIIRGVIDNKILSDEYIRKIKAGKSPDSVREKLSDKQNEDLFERITEDDFQDDSSLKDLKRNEDLIDSDDGELISQLSTIITTPSISKEPVQKVLAKSILAELDDRGVSNEEAIRRAAKKRIRGEGLQTESDIASLVSSVLKDFISEPKKTEKQLSDIPKKIKEPVIKGKDKIAEGIDELVTAFGGKAAAIVNFKNPSALSALTKIAEGIIEETGFQGEKLINEIKRVLKEKFGSDFNEEAIDEVSQQIEESVKAKPEVVAKKKEAVKKVPKGKIKTSISERLDKSILSPEAKKIFDKSEKIDVEKQDDVISNAIDFVKETGDEVVVDLFSQDSNITEKNRSFAIAALYKVAERSHAKSINNKLSKEERAKNAVLAARAFKRIESLSVSGGRGSAIQQKLTVESAIGLSIKTISSVNAERNFELNKEDESLGKKRSEVVDDINKAINEDINEVFSNDMEALIEENKQLKDAIDKLITKGAPKGADIVERKKKARKRIDGALDRLKKRSGSTLTAGGLTSEGIEDVTDLIIGYVQLGALNTAQIIKKVVSNLKSIGIKADVDEIKNISGKIDDFKDLKNREIKGDEGIVEEVVGEFISAKDISKVAKDYYISGISTSKSLSEEFVKELDLDPSEARKIAGIIQGVIDLKIRESMDKELNRKLKKPAQLTEEEKILRKDALGENNKLINKVLSSVHLGALNSPDFTNDFAEKYNFVEITDKIINELNTVTKLINKAEEAGAVEIRNKAVTKLNNLIGDLKPKDAKFYAEIIRELDFLSALSGINTQGNSMAGASLGTIINFVSDSIRSGGLFSAAWRYAVRRALSPSNLKAGVSAAKDSAKFNHSKFNSISYFEFSQRANNKQGSVERQMLKGTLDYLRGVSKGKSISENARAIVKTMGQSLLQGYRMTFLLLAQDTLLTSINSEYLSAKEEYLKKSKELGLKGFETLITNKELAKSLDQKLGFNQIKEFEKEAQEELNDFYNEIVDQVDQDIKDGFVEKNKRARTIDQRAKEILGVSFFKGWKSKILGGKSTAKYERYISRRTKEKLDAKKEEDIYKEAVETSKDWVSMSQRNVDGLHGELHRMIQKGFSFKEADNLAQLAFRLLGTGLIKFTRIASVTASNVQSSIPVIGLIPSVYGAGRDAEGNFKFGWKWKQNKELMTRRIVTNAIMTGVGALMFDNMFKWDDEEDEWVFEECRLIDVTAIAFGDWAKNLQADEGRKDFAIRFRTSCDSEWSTWRSVKYFPQLLPVIGILGGLSDNIKQLNTEEKQGEFEDKSKFSQVINREALLDLPMRSMMEGSFNSLGRSLKRIQREKDESSAAAMAVSELIFQPAKSLTQPAFIRDVFNEYRAFKGDALKESKSFYDKMAKDYYMIDSFTRDKTDLFGNKIPKQSRFDNWYRGYLKMSDTHKELKLIFKYPSLTVPYYQPPASISVKKKKLSQGKTGVKFRTFREGYTLESDESKNFLADTQKAEFKRLVLKRFDKLNMLSEVDLDKKLKELRNKSIEFAKEETIDNFEGTEDIKVKE